MYVSFHFLIDFWARKLEKVLTRIWKIYFTRISNGSYLAENLVIYFSFLFQFSIIETKVIVDS